MPGLADLPALNALLNSATAVFLAAGYGFIRFKRVGLHRFCMLSALACSAAFLTSYLVYHHFVGHVPFRGTGPIRMLYFGILLSHTVLAVVIVPMAVMTVARAFGGRFEDHARLARRTLPPWFYVSMTGVLIYFFVYRWFTG
jgi:putative membrane protein